MRYEIRGRVIDQFTGDGISGVRVEAWDADFGLDDYLGSATTLTDGSFAIAFDDSAFADIFFDNWPDLYFKVYCYGELLASTESSVRWNVTKPHVGVEIKAPHSKPPACDERHIYLKIEPLENYSPVNPEDKPIAPAQYGRDCMRGHGHENGLIPQPEIEARALTAVVYREYLDSGYLIPKPDKLIAADVNEPSWARRVPGTVIYTRPCQRLIIHVWNTDDVPHSLHTHGLRYGIDSDGSWPFGTAAAHHGGRSDAICPDETWTYTFDVPDNAVGAWPFHDHTHPHDNKIDQGLFGGIVVLGPCDRPPRRFVFPWEVLRPVYVDIGRLERRPLFPEGRVPERLALDEDAVVRLAPHVHAGRLTDRARLRLQHHLHGLEEVTLKALSRPRRIVNTDHVPVFFHVMSNPDTRPAFDTDDIEEFGGEAELTFDAGGDFDYFCRHHPEMEGTVHVVPGGPALVTVTILQGPPMAFSPADVTVGVGGTVRWINNTSTHHTATSTQGASMPTHCINGRGFTGNTPTIVGRTGQRIRWYVFNLDTSPTWHNFHPHAMRWKFGGEAIDIRSLGPAESFVVESEIPPVLLLTTEEEKAQRPEHRPKGATLHHLKGDFVFHCHVHHHMMNGMVGLVRARQSVWLTEEMAHEIAHRTGLALDDGTNACPDVDPHPCRGHGGGRWEEVPGTPEVLMMHSVLLPGTERVLFWGRTRADQSRVWDYSTPAGAYMPPANQPADDPVLDVNTSDLWSAEHTLLDTAAGTVLIHGGFTPNKAFAFDPGSLTWTRVGDTTFDRFYATTLTLGDGRAVTLYGGLAATKTFEIYTHGVGWASAVDLAPAMDHHLYYPWTYLLPDGRLFIAGPHDPTHRFDLATPLVTEAFATIHGNRSTGGEKGSSVLLMLRPPDYEPMVYIIGGNSAATEQTAEAIDLSAPAPAWAALPNLNVARPQQFTATLLPDGRVFIAGGISGAGGPCEIFDPRNPGDGWALGPDMTYPRTYHSSFLLLADGSVLGGGAPPDADPPAVYTPHERFFPEYFDMLRPVISAAPATINYGGTFVITTPNASETDEVVLLRPGAVTHGFNMSQRGLELVITGIGAGTVTVEEPPQPNLAPPGWYLLFILNASRVPSVGRWVRLTP
jgi:plastocyanin